MKTTLNLSDELVATAMRETGIKEKTKLIHMGLQSLIAEKSRKRLAALFGADKKATIAPRRRHESPRR